MKLWPELAVLIIATHQQGCTHADISVQSVHLASITPHWSGWLMFEKDWLASRMDIWQHRLHISKRPAWRWLVFRRKAGRRHRRRAQLLLLVPNRISAASCIKVFKLIPAASSRLPFPALHPISVVSWSGQWEMGVISSAACRKIKLSAQEQILCFLPHHFS